MTTATVNAQSTADNQALIKALMEQVSELSKKLEVATKPAVAKPVGKRSTVEKLEQPLPVHTESERVQALKDGDKAKKGRESKRDLKPGSKGFQEPKPRKKVELREQLINDVLNGRDRFGLLTYREAQKLCGMVGLKASGSHDLLTQRWSAYVKKETTPDMLKSKPKEKRRYLGLSYRQAQRLVKWCRESFTSNQLAKLKLQRNTGWDRVEQNCDALLDSEAFWEYVENDKYAEELNEFLGTEFIVNADDENAKF